MHVPSWLRPLATRSNPIRKRRAQPRPAFRPRVERLEDRAVPTVYTVTNTGDGGAGALRQAILDANATPGADSIQFAIPAALKSPAGNWWTIQVPFGNGAVYDGLP